MRFLKLELIDHNDDEGETLFIPVARLTYKTPSKLLHELNPRCRRVV